MTRRAHGIRVEHQPVSDPEQDRTFELSGPARRFEVVTTLRARFGIHEVQID